MIRIPFYLLIIFSLTVVLCLIPKYVKAWKARLLRLLFAGYLSAVFGITLFFRLIKIYILLPIYHLMHPEGWVPDPQAPVIVGQAGSTWTASKQGIHGLNLIWIAFSDPNTPLYIIPSCLLNILFFMPLGMLLPCVFPAYGNDRKKCLICGFLLSLLIELLQTITKLGMGDWKDLICNTLGTLLGFILWKKYIKKHWSETSGEVTYE